MGFLENLKTAPAGVAAATAVVGYDLLTGLRDARTPEARNISALKFTGANAAGECAIEVYVNRQLVGTYHNTSTGLVADENKDTQKMATYVPGMALIEAKVIKAPTVSPVMLTLEFSPARSSYGGTRRRWTGRRTGVRRTGGSRLPRFPAGGGF